MALRPNESRLQSDENQQGDSLTRVGFITVQFRDEAASGPARQPLGDEISSSERSIDLGSAEQSASEKGHKHYPDTGHGVAALEPHTGPDDRSAMSTYTPAANVQETRIRSAGTERIGKRPSRQPQLNSGEVPTGSHTASCQDRPAQLPSRQDFAAEAMPLPQEEPISNNLTVQTVIVFFGKVFIFTSCEAWCNITSILLQSSGERCFEGKPSGAIRLSPTATQNSSPRRNHTSPPKRIVLFVDVRHVDNIRLNQELEITLTDENSQTAAAILPCRTVGFDSSADAEAIGLLKDLEREDVLPLEAFALLQKLGAATPINFSLDNACRTVDGVMVDGWIENAASRNYFLTAADLSAVILSRDIFYKPRLDVTRHLAERGVNTVTHSHGFIGHLHVLDARSPHILAFLLEGGVAYHVANLSTKPTRSTDQMLELCWQSITGSDIPRATAIRALAAPLLKKREAPITYNPVVVVEGPETIRVSVVVPFYREWRFVRSIAMMQMWFPPDYEWVLVCDDPDIEGNVRQVLMSRIGLLRNRTLLVKNAANYGFSTANNIGAHVSRGQFLLFMNSDIWVKDVQALETAVEAIAADRFGAIGFRLCFEDGSVQHDGMTFVRSLEFDDLFLAHHPGKGLPPDGDGKNEIVEVESATGALLLISRLTFNGMGGFSNKYARGDFEDVDLCLRLRRDGKKIGLVRSNSCFHLERQSIRLMGASSQRMAVTLSNCVTFNDLWSDDLVRWSKS